MTSSAKMTRRTILGATIASAAGFAMPWSIRNAAAAEPIKIGAPLALTGPLGSVGQQLKRGCELWTKVQNAKGGLLGRPIQLLIEDNWRQSGRCRAQGAGDGRARWLQHLHRDYAVL